MAGKQEKAKSLLSLSPKEVIKENKARANALFPRYNPITGEGSLEERLPFVVNATQTIYLPVPMFADYSTLSVINNAGGLHRYRPTTKEYKAFEVKTADEFRAKYLASLDVNRQRYDFEYWAIKRAYIKHKDSRKIVPFALDAHQRYIVHALEQQRTAGKPIRLIILKARQLGSSTVCILYLQWIATQHKTNWNFAIASHNQTASNVIKRIFDLSLETDSRYVMTNLGGSPLVRKMSERGCVMRIGSAVSPESLRGEDLQMIHYSEVGLWKKTREIDPDDLIASISGSVEAKPYTCIIMESTAKTKGSFFYEEWSRAERGESAFVPVFVAWWKVVRFQIPFRDDKELVQYYHKLNDYGKFLWKLGATLEGIHWYFETKASKNMKTSKMKNENPSTEEEAFTSVGERVFDVEYVANLKKTVRDPQFIGEVSSDAETGEHAFENVRFVENTTNGRFKIWEFPELDSGLVDRYIVAMDVGGRSDKADYSVIRVIDRYWTTEPGGVPEIVATWRGHEDVDLTVWIATKIAKAYDNALLVVERNTIDSRFSETQGDHTVTVFNKIVPYYDNIYIDHNQQNVNDKSETRYGFFTGSGSSSQSKTAIVDLLTEYMRESKYIERDLQMIVECDSFVYKGNGVVGAEDGTNNHDDVVMATGIGLMVSDKTPMPRKKLDNFSMIQINDSI